MNSPNPYYRPLVRQGEAREVLTASILGLALMIVLTTWWWYAMR